jgi:transposase InsO family protein
MRFDMICEANEIEHQMTRPNQPWTNGQAQRVNRTIKEATVKCCHYKSHDQRRKYSDYFIAAYNFARQLKAPTDSTPYEDDANNCI